MFQNRFTKFEKIRTYATRGANKSNYFLSIADNTAGQKTQNKLEYREVKLIYEKLKCKLFNLFKKLSKESLLSLYTR